MLYLTRDKMRSGKTYFLFQPATAIVGLMIIRLYFGKNTKGLVHGCSTGIQTGLAAILEGREAVVL